MGALTLPASGIVCLDANSFIYSVEKIEPYASLLFPLWVRARAGQVQIWASDLVLLEVLVKPVRDGDQVLAESFRALLLHNYEVQLMRIDQPVLEEAVRLRALYGLKTPDALHAASALLARCALFVTNDPVFRRVPGLPVAVLHEVATAP